MDIPQEQDEKTQELLFLANKMNDENKEDTLDYARMKYKKQERESKKNGKRDRDKIA